MRIVFTHELGTLGIGSITEHRDHFQTEIQTCRDDCPRDAITVVHYARINWNGTETREGVTARPVEGRLIASQQARSPKNQGPEQTLVM